VNSRSSRRALEDFTALRVQRTPSTHFTARDSVSVVDRTAGPSAISTSPALAVHQQSLAPPLPAPGKAFHVADPAGARGGASGPTRNTVPGERRSRAKFELLHTRGAAARLRRCRPRASWWSRPQVRA
jgi:hypothetical protein